MVEDAALRSVRRRRRPRRKARIAIGAVILVVLGVQALLVVFVRPYANAGPAMEPTLHCARPVPGCVSGSKDRVVVVKYVWRDPRRADLVTFHAPGSARRLCGKGGTFLRRLVGMPGERISERKGVFFVNGRRLDEPYVEAARRDGGTRRFGRLARDRYFVLGDNRRLACDSRVFGAVRRSALIGRVVAIYWPFGRISIR